MRSSAGNPGTTGRQAAKILTAWASGDQPLLQKELWKTHQIPDSELEAVEEERLELLQAAAQGMLRAGAPLGSAPLDAQVRCCLDLLEHLARTADAPRMAAPACV